jgi:UDP-N-acetylmuramoylalanine--D-glutamate ligase
MKKLVVLGAGESGVGTALLGKQKGFDVLVSDKGTIAEKYKQVLVQNAIEFEENQHTESKIFTADIVMKSPGIPDTIPLIEQLHQKKIAVVSEIEFANSYTDATLVGITGSNGKTTTTLITYHLLQKANKNVGMAGNIGDSFAKQIAEQNYSTYVLELSSFQLDGIQEFRPHIAIITNITPDHLDRYAYDFDLYVNSKFRITKNQNKNDFLIYDADDEVINNWLNNNTTKATLVPFSLEKELEFGAFVEQDKIILRLKTKEVLMDINDLKLKGKHNVKNAMAGAMASKLLEARKKVIAESLSDFEGVEHRLENVQKVNGVQYINDSKATNVNSVYYALECMDTPTVWIVGGVDKGNDYSDLLPLVREKVKAVVCLGLDNQKIIDTFQKVVDVLVETAGVEEAVKVADKIAKEGDTVLLSPACSSFDLFQDYKERGMKFKEAVRNL